MTNGKNGFSQAMQEAVSKLKNELEKQGLSVKAFAEKAGVGRPYLHRVLTGQQDPSVGWLEKVFHALGIDLKINFKKSA